MAVRKGGGDILVVGAGIFGLACALACARRGWSVVVADRAAPGAGASGGPVGALAPHLPETWNPRKQFQLDALLAAPGFWQGVGAAGGIDPGFARPGRLLPLATPAARARALTRAAAAGSLWPRPFRWRVLDPGALPPCLAADAAPCGAVHETLSARLDPRRAVAALVAALRRHGGEIRTGWHALALVPGGVRFVHGVVPADSVILAPGTGAAALLGPVLGARVVTGVKGQAARLGPVRPFAGPLICADGLYVVPHADGSVAVGSTSEADWSDAAATDARLDGLVARAGALCPPLLGARVLDRWAGLRPRGPRPDPMLGPLPGLPGAFLATGGFRTGLALAPAVGEALADMVEGRDPGLPGGFAIADHLAVRDRHLADLGTIAST